jgi:redox-sensitive bicupin YhaK (pirin superfamily)
MMKIRKSKERGHVEHGWLTSNHTFSFADYYDPEHMGFRSLRVINEDWVTPSEGFDTHPHKDMEIVTYIVEGAVKHKDSMGNGSTIRPGEVQRMTAGTGVQHSEFNESDRETLHLLQIWILPEKKGLEPGYEQKAFSESDRRNRLKLVASRDGRDGSVVIHQDAQLYASVLESGAQVEHDLKPGRGAWLQIVKGKLEINGKSLEAGDGAAISDEKSLKISARDRSEFLLFDLA